MKTTNTKTKHNETGKAKHDINRKRRASVLDPYTEQLLQMDEATKTIHDIAAWLKTQGVETSASNVSAFLISRRRRELREQLNLEKDLGETVQEWFEAEGGPKLETLMGVFKMLVLNLATRKEMDPQLLQLADRLARTAMGHVNDQSRADYRTRKLVMEEAKHAEWIKVQQQRALGYCLDEAKKYPAVADMFRGAFAALEAAIAEEERAKAPRTNIQAPEKQQAPNAKDAPKATTIEDEHEEEDENESGRRVEGEQPEARVAKRSCGRPGKGKAPRNGESTKIQAPNSREDSNIKKQGEGATVPEFEEDEGGEADLVEQSEIDPMENATWRAQQGY